MQSNFCDSCLHVQISSSCYSVELHITDLLDMGSYQVINNNIGTICSNIFRTFLDWNFLWYFQTFSTLF